MSRSHSSTFAFAFERPRGQRRSTSTRAPSCLEGASYTRLIAMLIRTNALLYIVEAVDVQKMVSLTESQSRKYWPGWFAWMALLTLAASLACDVERRKSDAELGL